MLGNRWLIITINLSPEALLALLISALLLKYTSLLAEIKVGLPKVYNRIFAR